MEVMLDGSFIYGRPSPCAIRSNTSEDDVQKCFSGSKVDSTIASTSLVQSPELEWIENLGILDETCSPLQQMRPPWNDSVYRGLTNRRSSQGNSPSQQASEQLFHHITISLMSELELNYNEICEFRPNGTEVTLATRNNIYVYTRRKLWLAHGISIGVTLLTVSFGLTAIFANRAHSSHEFSAYLGLSRDA
ncbi:hypothetical protein CKM354_001234800 [Cercospora kikuchii]|uniref:Uncharacterized protein n=1 Tax=Cercospora kikuchii TaxID=84275 RepID=A0A9P3L103_9PEZI|nr:uncharacterized protein CKM354_001234800 [Cercospora kikuchii]GIZ49316.1 hypothetical protein CKM354_001234800 [Cercospora kikuchii]